MSDTPIHSADAGAGLRNCSSGDLAKPANPRTRLFGSSMGLYRRFANLDPVDQKEVRRAPMPCGHTFSGHPYGGRAQTWLYCNHAIAARAAVLRAFRPDIADAQFGGILPHLCHYECPELPAVKRGRCSTYVRKPRRHGAYARKVAAAVNPRCAS